MTKQINPEAHKSFATKADGADGFLNMPARLRGEREERLTMSARSMPYHNVFLDELVRGIFPNDLVLIGAPSGMGKCLAPETPVLLYGGEVVRADQVHVGDRLMGPDSKPRTVKSINADRGPMFEIVPIKGESWRCNDVHVLTLVHAITGNVIDIALDDYLRRSPTFRREHKLFTTGVEFAEQREELPIDPYFFGLWFGDGAKTVGAHGLTKVVVTTMDREVEEACNSEAARFGLKVMPDVVLGKCPNYRIVNKHGAGNPLLELMRVVLGPGLAVPHRYLVASRSDRLAFLAGWLDSDGSLECGCFDFVQKRRDWADAVLFLARSLGFRATHGTKTIAGEDYSRICISGDVDQIPTRLAHKQASPRLQRKDHHRTGFDVVPIGDGDYFGFTLDGDGRFLLGDFTVTHNTDFALSIAINNARQDHKVAYFALEAEPRELERRQKFAWISAEAYRRNVDRRLELNYADWYAGRCEEIVGKLDAEADRWFDSNLALLWTFYRGQKFDKGDLRKHVEAIAPMVEMIVIDHLHYVDADDDQANEHTALGETTKAIRDIALLLGKPVVLVAHLRKRDQRARTLMPTLDDFHGSSNITKIATQVITIGPASPIDAPKWWLAPTFMAVLKDRRAGVQPFVALQMFDRRTRRYEDHYTLGRLTKGGADWEQIKLAERPGWANGFKQMELDV